MKSWLQDYDIDFGVKNNDKDPKFELCHHMKISKCKKKICKRSHSKRIVDIRY